jgi:hypothetical protein
MLDKDGHVSYSQIIILNISQTTEIFSIYPNPIIADNINLKINSASDAMGEILIDFSGKIMLHKKQIIHKGTNAIQFNGFATLAPGVYTLQFISNNNIVNKKISIIR